MLKLMKIMITMLILVTVHTTCRGATVAFSSIKKTRSGSSKIILIKPNVSKQGRSDSINSRFSLPPSGHDFTKIPHGARYELGKLLVRFTSRTDGTQRPIAEKERIVRRLGGRILKHYRLIPGLVTVALPPRQTVRAALIIYNRTREIQYAEPSYIFRIPEQPRPKPAPRRITPARKPSALRSHSPGLRIRHISPIRKTSPLSALRQR